MFYSPYCPIIDAECKVAKAVSLLARLYTSPFFQYLKEVLPSSASRMDLLAHADGHHGLSWT